MAAQPYIYVANVINNDWHRGALTPHDTGGNGVVGPILTMQYSGSSSIGMRCGARQGSDLRHPTQKAGALTPIVRSAS